MSSVFLCSPTNSQMFTTCCETAICDDQERCPRCKEYVYPDDGVEKYSNHERSMRRWSWAYGRQKRGLR